MYAKHPEGEPMPVNRDGKVDKAAPFVTPRHVRVPHLAEKIELLYVNHPFIRKQYELADELKISPATLTSWIRGVLGSDGLRINPGTIPAKHFSNLLKVFGVPAPVLEMVDLAEFKKAFATFESGRGAWEKLIRALPDDLVVEILVNSDRRIVDPDVTEANEGILRIRSDDEVAIRIPNPALRHGVLLQQDRHGWSLLAPASSCRSTEIDDELIFPRPASDGGIRFAAIEGSGLHQVLAILTRESLPGWIMDAFLGSDSHFDATLRQEDLDRTVAVFHNLLAAGPEKCRMFSRRFIVVNPQRRGLDAGIKANHE